MVSLSNHGTLSICSPFDRLRVTYTPRVTFQMRSKFKPYNASTPYVGKPRKLPAGGVLRQVKPENVYKKDVFTPFQTLLPAVVQKLGLERQVEGASVCHQFRSVARGLWGEEVDAKVHPRSYARGVLTVEVAHSGWAQEVQVKKITVLKELRARCANEKLLDLRIRVA